MAPHHFPHPIDGVRFSALGTHHAKVLLAFENANREWFRRTGEDREPDFYSHKGVRNHIAELGEDHRHGRIWPLLVFSDDGELVGRANLRRLSRDRRGGSVGYRIAEHACNQGIATQALTELMELAYRTQGFRYLTATVNVDNHASQRVLEKRGFVRVRYLYRQPTLTDAWEYRHSRSVLRHWWWKLVGDN
ncbi:GNAT family N-acetyltransferase [Pokkaliibacter sp. CJK22405]|uniref:GNAT family N-acetyltransferase n=1 Tax=Pokkaliibacter sp. CJK22405 TaxID=3384615 RepID=UPI0039850478